MQMTLGHVTSALEGVLSSERSYHHREKDQREKGLHDMPDAYLISLGCY